jgi:predicted Zn-dependent protease
VLLVNGAGDAALVCAADAAQRRQQPRRDHAQRLQADADGAPSASRSTACGLAEAESSMRPLSAADKAAARPYTLRITPMPRGGFAELARQSGGVHSEARLRLLNGLYGSGQEPAPGSPVKVIN